MSRSLRFSIIWLVSLVVILASVGAINCLIDPYDVFGSSRIIGINQFKSQAKNHVMLAKTYQVRRTRPVTVLIGTSRVLIGLDAKSLQWPAYMRPVYNYGVPGAGASTYFRNLQEAFQAGHLRYAFVALDFENFLEQDPTGAAPTETERRFSTLEDGRPNPDRPLQQFNDSILSLFTLGALEDSITTLAAQRRQPALDLRQDGSSTEAEFVWAARTEGYHALFAQKDTDVQSAASDAAKVLANWNGPMPNLNDVARIIAFCRLHKIELTLIIPPTHKDALNIYWKAGLWPRLEQLKVELAQIVQKEGGGRVPLWDFEGYDRYATEAVPADDDRKSATEWFWEPSHFKKSLGELIIGSVLNNGHPDYGIKITPENVALRNYTVRVEHNTAR